MTAVLAGAVHAETAPPLEWYLPASSSGFDARIPRPEAVLGHPVGARIALQESLVAWFESLAEISERVTLLELGDTHEGRRQIAVAISAPRHVDDLDRVRLKRVDDEPSAPLVTWHGFGAHGDEPGGVQAAMLLAWYLAADTSPETRALLERAVVMIDPLQNPDGYVRFSRWVSAPGNGSGPTVLGAPAEPWPGGAGNHYAFDLARDWLIVQQPETRNRLRVLSRHEPDLFTDHHEAIGEPGARHAPACGARTLDGGSADDPATWLTERMRDEALASAGLASEGLASGKPRRDAVRIATETFHWADLHGAVGLALTAVAAPGGDAFALIRGHVRTVLNALRGAVEYEQALEAWRGAYRAGTFTQVPTPAGWLIGDAGDPTRGAAMVDLLKSQGLEVFGLLDALERGGHVFTPGHGWLIPAYGKRSALAHALLAEEPQAAGCRREAVALATAMGVPGVALEELPVGLDTANRVVREPAQGGRDAAGWVLGVADFLAPAVIHRLKGAGVPVRAARESFTADETATFPAGSVVVRRRELPRLRIPSETFLARVVRGEATMVAVQSVAGIEGGDFVELRPSRIGLVGGDGVSAESAGGLSNLLEQRLGMAVTPVHASGLSGERLARLTHLVLPDGDYMHLASDARGSLADWIAHGGVLVAIGGAAHWVQRLGWLHDRHPDVVQVTDAPGTESAPDPLEGDAAAIRLVAGNPLGFGLEHSLPSLPRRRFGPLDGPADGSTSVAASYLADRSAAAFDPNDPAAEQGAPAVLVANVGAGLIVAFADDPLDRGIWWIGERLLANALSFAELLALR